MYTPLSLRNVSAGLLLGLLIACSSTHALADGLCALCPWNWGQSSSPSATVVNYPGVAIPPAAASSYSYYTPPYSPVMTQATPVAAPISPVTTSTSYYTPEVANAYLSRYTYAAPQQCYKPEVKYEWTFHRIPRTNYVAVNVADPCTGQPRSVMQPVTEFSLLPWLHQEAVVKYTPVPCAQPGCAPFAMGGCPTGTCATGACDTCATSCSPGATFTQSIGPVDSGCSSCAGGGSTSQPVIPSAGALNDTPRTYNYPVPDAGNSPSDITPTPTPAPTQDKPSYTPPSITPSAGPTPVTPGLRTTPPQFFAPESHTLEGRTARNPNPVVIDYVTMRRVTNVPVATASSVQPVRKAAVSGPANGVKDERTLLWEQMMNHAMSGQ